MGVWVQFERRTTCSDGLVIVSLGPEDESRIRVYDGREWIQLLGPLNLAARFLEPAQLPQKIRIPVVAGRVIRSQFDGLPELRFGSLPIPFRPPEKGQGRVSFTQ